MKREVDLNEISDGRLYSSGDMVRWTVMTVKAALHAAREWEIPSYWIQWICGDCNSEKENFDTLLANYLELNVVDGMVLPNLKMAGEEEACLFLKGGRCSIHGYRPGICRLFLLDVFMRRMDSSILSRSMSVRSRNVVK